MEIFRTAKSAPPSLHALGAENRPSVDTKLQEFDFTSA